MKFLSTLILIFSLQNNVLADDKDSVKKGEFLKKELNLSDDQLTKVKAIKKELKPEIKESKKNLSSLRKDFMQALKDPKVSTEDLKKKFEYIQDLKSELNLKKFNLMLKMREVLTPEQLTKFQEVRTKMKKKWKQKHKKDCDE